MITVNRDVILKNGYEKAVKIALLPYLKEEEIFDSYKEKMLAYGRDCGYTFSEDEVTAYIAEQRKDMEELIKRNDTDVPLRF